MKRYDLIYFSEDVDAKMAPAVSGKYVLFEDHEKAVDALTRKHQRACTMCQLETADLLSDAYQRGRKEMEDEMFNHMRNTIANRKEISEYQRGRDEQREMDATICEGLELDHAAKTIRATKEVEK